MIRIRIVIEAETWEEVHLAHYASCEDVWKINPPGFPYSLPGPSFRAKAPLIPRLVEVSEGDQAETDVELLRRRLNVDFPGGGPWPILDEVERLRDRVAGLATALRSARESIDKDHSGLAVALQAIRDEVKSRSWLTESRGCYEWDDDRYKEESYQLFQKVLGIVHTALEASGTRANETVNAVDAALAKGTP